MSVDQMLQAIRDVIGQPVDGTEAEVLEALLEEAHGWQMRLDEINDDDF